MTLATPSPSSLNDADTLVFSAVAAFEVPRVNKPSTCDQTKKKVPRGSTKRKVRHYERQWLEQEALTQQIATLEDQLHQKKASIKAKSKSKPTTSVWKRIAKCHMKNLQSSEAQRIWLQAAVTGKNALIDALVDLVRQQMRLTALIAAQSGGEFMGIFEPTDDVLYALDVRDIYAQYTQTDSVFNASGLDPASAETTAFHRTVTKSADGEVSIQYVRRQQLLFNYEHTCESLWMLSHLLHRQEERVDYPDIQDPDNTIATMRLPGEGLLSLKERFVSCRFTEGGRTVLVWKASLVSKGACAGMQTDETGWTVIRPSAFGSGTVVEVCLRQVPAHANASVDSTAANHFDNLLQGIIQENSKEITNGAKALLLENMLSGIHA